MVLIFSLVRCAIVSLSFRASVSAFHFIRLRNDHLGELGHLVGWGCRCPDRSQFNDARDTLVCGTMEMGEVKRHDGEVVPTSVIVGQVQAIASREQAGSEFLRLSGSRP